MTLEACGAGSNHQSYERLQLDNGALYRNVVNTKHVRTISLNLVLPKKLTPDDPLTPKMGKHGSPKNRLFPLISEIRDDVFS